jgi:hypothetical protein
VTDRHLAPHELQKLVDGEEVDSALLMHLERCEHCREELEAQHRVVALLESLPRFQPAPLFTYRVMREVNVFEPWYVTLADTVRKLVPRSRPGRVAVISLGVLAAFVVTAVSLWVVRNAALLTSLAGVAMGRARQAVANVLGGLGERLGIGTPFRGEEPVLLGALAVLVMVLGVAAVLRLMIGGARRSGVR